MPTLATCKPQRNSIITMNAQKEEDRLTVDPGTVDFEAKARCTPSTTFSGDDTNSDAGVESLLHFKSSSDKIRPNTTGKCDGDISSSSSSSSRSSPFEEPPSSTAQAAPAKKPSNPPLLWTADELRLVSRFRLGMMNTYRRKRPKKHKDAPKRPLR